MNNWNAFLTGIRNPQLLSILHWKKPLSVLKMPEFLDVIVHKWRQTSSWPSAATSLQCLLTSLPQRKIGVCLIEQTSFQLSIWPEVGLAGVDLLLIVELWKSWNLLSFMFDRFSDEGHLTCNRVLMVVLICHAEVPQGLC